MGKWDAWIYVDDHADDDDKDDDVGEDDDTMSGDMW